MIPFHLKHIIESVYTAREEPFLYPHQQHMDLCSDVACLPYLCLLLLFFLVVAVLLFFVEPHELHICLFGLSIV